MRIFISPATKNKEIVLKFAELLESISIEIEVFCSLRKGRLSLLPYSKILLFDKN